MTLLRILSSRTSSVPNQMALVLISNLLASCCFIQAHSCLGSVSSFTSVFGFLTVWKCVSWLYWPVLSLVISICVLRLFLEVCGRISSAVKALVKVRDPTSTLVLFAHIFIWKLKAKDSFEYSNRVTIVISSCMFNKRRSL